MPRRQRYTPRRSESRRSPVRVAAVAINDFAFDLVKNWSKLRAALAMVAGVTSDCFASDLVALLIELESQERGAPRVAWATTRCSPSAPTKRLGDALNLRQASTGTARGCGFPFERVHRTTIESRNPAASPAAAPTPA